MDLDAVSARSVRSPAEAAGARVIESWVANLIGDASSSQRSVLHAVSVPPTVESDDDKPSLVEQVPANPAESVVAATAAWNT